MDEIIMSRTPFVIKGERCEFSFDGEEYLLAIIPTQEHGKDFIEFYLQKIGYGYVAFVIGLEANRLNLGSQTEKDAFILKMIPEWVHLYNEDLFKLTHFE